jgi:transposase
MSVYVGIDVHRKRSQVAVVEEDGAVRVNRNVPNGVETVLGVIGDLPIGAPVAFEAAYGWGWLVELLEDYGFEPHLVHPLRCKAIASARLKNDKVDAATLAQLLRADLLPEAWIAPLQIRQQRALLRHRCQLVRLRTLLRNRVHAVLADHGCDRPGSYFTAPGRAWLDTLDLPDASRRVVDDLLALTGALKEPIDALDEQLVAHARGDPRVKALMRIRRPLSRPRTIAWTDIRDIRVTRHRGTWKVVVEDNAGQPLPLPAPYAGRLLWDQAFDAKTATLLYL